jgi:hypothetical protein
VSDSLTELANSVVLSVAKLPIGIAGGVSALIVGGAMSVRLSFEIVDIPLRLFIGWAGGISLATGLAIALASGVLGLIAQARRLPVRAAGGS